MDQKRDYYEVLGCDKNASEEELKRAYRKVAKKYNTNYLKIAALNGIVNPNRIYVGQKIRVR